MATSSRPNLGNTVVVGGCGFVGSHIVSMLKEKYEANVSVLDLRTTRNRHEGVAYYDCNITSIEEVRSVLDKVKPAVIIHTASPNLIEHRKDLMYSVNVKGTKNLIEAAGEAGGVKAFVYTSSASVVSDNATDLINADERWPYVEGAQQSEYYTQTKIEAEKTVLNANRKYGNMLTTAIRPAGILGEGDVQVVNNMINVYEKRKTGFQLGDNNNLFDFTYVGNVAHAHILAARALLNTHLLTTAPLDHERVDGEAFFITNDSPVYFWDFPRAIWNIAGDTTGLNVTVIQKDWGLALASLLEWVYWAVGKKPTLTRQQVRYSCMTRYYNIGKAKERLGYRPIVSLDEGVERTTKWFLTQSAATAAKKDQ
ncbi:hypothetical protein L228DRAFT_267710 [Xylona heveae TC161]|uniref:Sterol-4-alpha-carboxylate 3-dehydrogenase ERG26, decarboxylating n=1 Tax=Xylona heveae (strain CBS 132557 / TC161) TaxID=1328760 RepID=A0A165HML4_XYLHT|nr:hypothetical protein L228DRAFT_267710 [Xylona heveae TC161]KZF23740.1 hypothetical protein L228DRAFT_267710 [Xylona heveae TC161]